MRILVERGGVFLMRSYILHCGCDYLTNCTHYCIHIFCEPVQMGEEDEKSKYSTRASSHRFPPESYFDLIAGQFNYGRRNY